jgi:hypothetical protein
MASEVNRDNLIIFVTRDYKTTGLYQDEVRKIGLDKFKSIKFRHTTYSKEDFRLTLTEAKFEIGKRYYHGRQNFTLRVKEFQ